MSRHGIPAPNSTVEKLCSDPAQLAFNSFSNIYLTEKEALQGLDTPVILLLKHQMKPVNVLCLELLTPDFGAGAVSFVRPPRCRPIAFSLKPPL